VTSRSSREQAFAVLARLRVAPIFLESYRSPRLPENLDIVFGPPEEFFLGPEDQDAYTEGRLIPILDDGNFGVVTFYDPHDHTFVQKDVESPDERLTTFANWQQCLADLMIRIYENNEDDDQVLRIADLVGFKDLPRIVEFARPGQDPNSYHRRRAAFVATFGPR